MFIGVYLGLALQSRGDAQRFLKLGCKSLVASSSSSVMSHLMCVDSCYPLVNVYIAIENGHL